jgi:hypothetical protein
MAETCSATALANQLELLEKSPSGCRRPTILPTNSADPAPALPPTPRLGSHRARCSLTLTPLAHAREEHGRTARLIQLPSVRFWARNGTVEHASPRLSAAFETGSHEHRGPKTGQSIARSARAPTP